MQIDCNCPACKECKSPMSAELCENVWKDSDSWQKQIKALIPASDLVKVPEAVPERKSR